MTKKLGMIVLAFILLQFTFDFTYANASVFDNKTSELKTEVSPQVTHIQQKYQSGSINEFVNVLDVNLANTYTKLEIGLPNPKNSLKTTTNLAKEYSYSGHRVVGAVNASYFLGNGVPANLLAQNNEIINYGILGDTSESPTQNPIAFGISKTGKAIVDYYTPNLSFEVNGKEYAIDLINNERATNSTVLYTTDRKSTGTNQWGVELVVTGATQDTKSLHFGDHFSGVISGVTTYGSTGNSEIPSDGFVISIQNKQLADELSSVPEGTNIEVNLSIDEQWRDAQFMLAAGPLLVKDSKVNISMSTSSSFASTRSPRTAVAVDSTGTKVFLVTVDGRQTGHSNGTNLTDLASYLISIGASAAINLDGGGSTTMVARKPGAYYPTLVNSPSDGAERRVSAILQVINSAPQGKVKSFTLSGIPSDILKGNSFDLKIASAYDEYLNPITIEPSNVKWSVEGNVGTISGTTFTATAQGQGKIVGEYNGVRVEQSIKVVDVGAQPILLDSFDSVSGWTSTAAKAKATVSNSLSTEPIRQGSSSLKLTYDFTTSDTGTKAAYAVAKTPISIVGHPHNIGIWVYGDGAEHWLRGMLIDGTGTKHTIDFTAQGGLDWNGWKYVTAEVPTNIALPLKFDRLYVTQPTASLQNKGKIYFDQLQAVYSPNYKELPYTDVSKGYWAFTAINYLNEKQLINGYSNGTFKPSNSITRAEAATIIARELNLKATKPTSFKDVSKSHYAYDAIAAVEEYGIIKGRSDGIFSPNGNLTRAEMATILTRAYNLTGKSSVAFKDVPSTHWAYGYIQTLVANNLTGGYPDNTFRPNQQLSRAEFATFLYRQISK